MRGFVQFFAVALIGVCINPAVFLVGIEKPDLLPVVAKITAVGVAFIVNFTPNLTIVFKRCDCSRTRQGPSHAKR